MGGTQGSDFLPLTSQTGKCAVYDKKADVCDVVCNVMTSAWAIRARGMTPT